jgi:ABC-type phosphate/phosphonate transport system substrate-binding protein
MIRYLIILLFTTTIYAANLNIGYGSVYLNQFNKKDTMVALDLWIKEMLVNSNYTASFGFYDDSSKMADDFNNGRIDYVITYGLEFVKHFDKSKLVNGFSGGVKNPADENLIIVVHKDSTKEYLQSLKKPTIALRENDVSKLYINYILLKDDRDKDIRFIKTKKNNRALLKLFFKKADAAVVTQKTFNFANELNPQIGNKLKVIARSNIPASSFGFFRKGFNEDLRKKILKLGFAINNSPRGKQILTMFHEDSIVESKVEDIIPIQELYNNYNQLIKQKKD